MVVEPKYKPFQPILITKGKYKGEQGIVRGFENTYYIVKLREQDIRIRGRYLCFAETK